MTDRSPDPEARFSLRLRLARAALLWERVWPACWPPQTLLGQFARLATPSRSIVICHHSSKAIS